LSEQVGVARGRSLKRKKKKEKAIRTSSNLEQGEIGISFGTWSEHFGVEGGGASCGARALSSSSTFALRDLLSRVIASDPDASRKDFQARLATDHKVVGGTRDKK
jgi:hypothetical protein